jgi:hypothetical protein
VVDYVSINYLDRHNCDITLHYVECGETIVHTVDFVYGASYVALHRVGRRRRGVQVDLQDCCCQSGDVAQSERQHTRERIEQMIIIIRLIV